MLFRLTGFAICTGLLTAIVQFAILIAVRVLFSLKPKSLTGQLVMHIARRGAKQLDLFGLRISHFVRGSNFLPPSTEY
jgi:hypothetical protein